VEKMKEQRPFPFTGEHPRFRIRGWEELLEGEEGISATDMVRHFLITGETGSGKSVSAVMRLLEAILRYPEPEPYVRYKQSTGAELESEKNLQASVLVIDPKQELIDVVEREAAGRHVRRITYGESGGPVLHLFEGTDLRALGASEAVDFILEQSDFFRRDRASTREPSWNQWAGSILKDLVAVDMWLARRGLDQVKLLWARTAEAIAECDEDYKSVTAGMRYDRENYFKPIAALMSVSGGDDGGVALGRYIGRALNLGVPGEMAVRLMTLMSLAHNTRSCVLWTANGILADIVADEFAACVSLNPLEPPEAEKQLSVKEALDSGDIVVYVPSGTSSTTSDMVGRCTKSKFFQFAFCRNNKVRPFFYVVDEAHRFLTAGTQDGEQSLLDRCRAYRTGVVLATQSIASMAYRLGENSSGTSALQIMLNNCGNALYFRTSDIRTQDNLRERIPEPPALGRPHVIKVRPLTSLAVGSCYALRSNGRWGLFQVRLPK
jgi:hypothetical protein